ncbi:MAG: class I SAM-dependent methyltransferase [Chitinophagales bacterium]|nr:class I SAM-dependent methyltransferase [Chitinophagales bacterium]
MEWLRRGKSFLEYHLHSKSEQRIHSPFVFELLRSVFYQEIKDQILVQKIESRREFLKNCSDKISVTDLGTGKWKTSERKISDIARKSLKRKEYAQLIYRMVHHFLPKTTLELGTSLGLTTAYISQGYRDGQVITLEGCPNISQVAQDTFDFVGCQNIDRKIGGFDDVLSKILEQNPKFDLLFIDGNHSYEATIRYFHQLLPYTDTDSIFIFDDIHWSEGMERAWDEIKQHPQVKISIDIYEMGFIFLRNENHESSHFTIKFP